MTLAEALTHLKYIKEAIPISPLTWGDYEAVQLAIEAVNEVMGARGGNPALDGELLPSETETVTA